MADLSVRLHRAVAMLESDFSSWREVVWQMAVGLLRKDDVKRRFQVWHQMAKDKGARKGTVSFQNENWIRGELAFALHAEHGEHFSFLPEFSRNRYDLFIVAKFGPVEQGMGVLLKELVGSNYQGAQRGDTEGYRQGQAGSLRPVLSMRRGCHAEADHEI